MSPAEGLHFSALFIIHTTSLFCLAASLMQGTKKEFGIPEKVDCRTHCYVNSTFRLLSNDSETIQKKGVFEDQVHG